VPARVLTMYVTPETDVMLHDPDKNFDHDAQQRLEALLDCIAYLLAKRWLRDQYQQEATPLHDECEANDRRESDREATEPIDRPSNLE